MQILNVSGTHWVTLSTVGSKSGSIQWMDSMHMTPTSDSQRIIADLMQFEGPEISVHLCKVHKQVGTNDCGLFAVAYATAVCHGLDPTTLQFDQQKMREHMFSCIENNCASPFPISKEQPRRRAILKTINFEVHCVCHLPYDGAKMIKCSKCSRWYHMKCLKLKETKGTWFCSNCSSVPKGEYACIFTCRSTYISILQMISPLVLMEIINKSLKKVQVGATLYNNDLSIIQVTSCFNLRSLKNLFSISRLLK